MSVQLRLLLIISSLLTSLFFLKKIRLSKIKIEDAIFWLLFSILIILLSIFPGIISFAASILGIQSPVNFLFLLMLFILLIRVFTLTLKISMLELKLGKLVREIALEEVMTNTEKEKSIPC